MSKFTTPTEAKLNNARSTILLIVIFSIINIFAIAFADMYFLFSTYLPQIFISIGVISGDQTIFMGMLILSLVYILPYLLCWIFSKKRVGWMIAALVLFSIDSIFFLIDVPAYLAAGDVSFILDIAIRIYAFVCLIMGVVYGFKKKKEDASAPVQEFENAYVPLDTSRQITITRKKAFTGAAVPWVIYANQQEIGTLKNGETKTFGVPAHAFELGASLPNGMAGNSITVAQGFDPLHYQVSIKMGFTSNTLHFTPLD